MNVGKWLDGSYFSAFSDLIIIAEGYDWIVWKVVDSNIPHLTHFRDEADKNNLIKEWELKDE